MTPAVFKADCSEDLDLARLHMKRWQHDISVHSRVVVLCLHGIESHGDWFKRFASETSMSGVDCVYYDRIGNGKNLESPVQSLSSMLEDLKSVVSLLQKQYDHVVVIGMSWGGLLAAYAIQKNLISPSYSVLLVPGIFSLKTLSFSDLFKTIFCLLFSLKSEIPIPIDSNDFSLDAEIRRLVNNDPLRRRNAPARLLFETYSMRRSVRRSDLPKGAVEVWLSESDQIVDNKLVERYLKKQCTRVEIFEKHGHALIFECPDRLSHLLIERIRQLSL